MSEDEARAGSLPGLLERAVALSEQLVAENARLRRELDAEQAGHRSADEENHELASLYIATRQMHGTQDPRRVLAAVEEILQNFVGAKTFAIYVRDEASGALRPLLACGLALAALPPARPGSPIGDVCATGRAHVADDLTPTAGDAPPRVAVPLLLGDVAVGVIAIWAFLAHKQRLLEVDRALLELLSTHAARALDAARLAAGGAAAALDFATLADWL